MNTSRIFSQSALFFTVVLFLLTSNVLPARAGDDFETKGQITELTSSGLDVNGITFEVTNETEIEDDKYGNIAFADLIPGDFVEIRAELKEGRYVAEHIKREHDDDYDEDDDHHSGKHEIDTRGQITDLTNQYLDVNGFRFYITDKTEVESGYGLDYTYSDLNIGMQVRVKGYGALDDSLFADEIKVRQMHIEDESEYEVKGVIDSLDTEGIFLGGMYFKVVPATLIRLNNHVPGSFSDLKAGMFVELKAGFFDNAWVAVRISLEDDDNYEIEFTGKIDSVGTSFIHMLGYEVQIDENTQLLNHAREEVMISDFSKGMLVEVKGYRTSENTIQASRIKIEDIHFNEIELTGVISELGSGYVIIENVRFELSSSTVYLDHSRNTVSADQFTTGMLVEVKAYRQGDGTLQAVRIKMEDNHGMNELELTGFINMLAADSIRVSDRVFKVNSMTEVLDLQRLVMNYELLQVGQFVELKAYRQADGSWLAVRIKLEDGFSLQVLSGNLTGLNGFEINIDGPVFMLDDNSIILDAQYKMISSDDLSEGDKVTVWTVREDDNTSRVLQVQSSSAASVTSINSPDAPVNFPELFNLQANYPNPFNPETSIPFTLNSTGFQKVKLTVFDITGKEVTTLYNGILDGGSYTFRWNGRNSTGNRVASGIYFYQLSVGQSVEVRKMTLMK